MGRILVRCWEQVLRRAGEAFLENLSVTSLLCKDLLPRSLMKWFSETILDCSYFFIQGRFEGRHILEVNQGLYSLGVGCEDIQGGKSLAEG